MDNKAAHVAEIKRKHGDRTYTYHLVRRSYRRDGRVLHETLANISKLPAEIIELIRRALRGDTLIPAEEAFEIMRTRPHGHVAAALGTLRSLGLDRIIASRPSRMRDLTVALIISRILMPGSKLATARGLRDETLFSTLGEVLGVESADENDLYEAMDWLLPRQPRIEKSLAKKHLAEGSLVLYDITSTYFEGSSCALAALGYSRDGKKDKLQVVIGLLCTSDGCPVAVEVFEGNTGDPSTVPAQLTKIRQRFGIQRLVFVGDRGMITEARIRENLRPVDGLDWITSLRAPAIKKLAANGYIQMSLFDETDLAEVTHPDFPGERLVVCRNPALAQLRANKRQDLLLATERELDKIVAATMRPRQRLKGKDKIGVRVGKVLGRFKMQKHFTIDIRDDGFEYCRDNQKIQAEAALDGLYVVHTSVEKSTLDSPDTVAAYKGLSVVERAFRSLKTVDLRIRPIHHRLSDRVRSHVLLCMLAYYVEWHMRKALAPLLFDDENPDGARSLRHSVVEPAQRSQSAKEKASTKRTDDGLPIHSFQTMLDDLATLAKNRVRPKTAPSAEAFDMLTSATPLQQKAFELLGVSPNL